MRKPTQRVRAMLAVLACCLTAACDEPHAPSLAASGANTDRGRVLLERYGCGSCHDIPGVARARGQVGPPLARIAQRSYLGGVLPNTPENMMQWIRHPQQFEPRSAMPELGVSETEARDMTAYLYGLK